MRRVLPFSLLIVVVLLPQGCREPKDPEEGNLVLKLPESKISETHPERVSKLTIDGKDYSKPRSTQRTLQVTPAAGKDEVTVVFSFWPVTYVNTTRTKTVKLEKGKAVQVDLTQPQADDLIKPIYVPTSEEVTEQMCKLAKIGANDVVYDIGCGDGRMVIMAVQKFGARRGVGIDIREELIKDCNDNAKKAGVTDKVEFRAADALKIKDYSEASVVLLYLGDDLNSALKPTLKATLKPGARVVSHRFEMGSDWPPEVSEPIVHGKDNANERAFKVHLWTIQ
jgi:precorrin-6B methylase 2